MSLVGDARAENRFDAVAALSSYVAIASDTPSGEQEAAQFLANELHRHGIGSRLYVGPNDRTSLWASIGPSNAPAVVLLHHLDVVPPGGPRWRHEPYSATLDDGELWGRGTIDSKGLGIAHLGAFLELAKQQNELTTRVVFLATADEESGGEQGLGWLVDAHPDLLNNVVVALTEGGVNRIAGEGLLWWGIEFQQKRPLWLRVSYTGRAGHGARLDLNTAPKQLIRGLAAVESLPRVYRATEAVTAYLEGIEKELGSPRGPSLKKIRSAIENGTVETLLRIGQHQLFLDTVQITRLRSGGTHNVVPATANAVLDARLLPDTDADAFLDRLRRLLGDGARVDILHSSPPVPASPTQGLWWDALASALGQGRPAVPLFISGATDARYLRRLGIPTYGVSPFVYPPEVRRGIHGPDERVPVREFRAGVQRMIGVVEALVEATAAAPALSQSAAR